MEIGYVRVSSEGQKTDRQLAELNLPAECLYVDRTSGKDVNRPELQNMLKALRPGDVLHIHSLDRLARNLKDLMSILDKLTEKGVEVRFHKENLAFTGDKQNPMSRLMLQIFGALAEWERSLIRERQAEGIRAAKRKGKPMGRPTTVTEDQRERVREALRKDMLYNIARLSRETGVPATTCRYIRKKMQEQETEVAR
ncbi:MAG: recombinase family protein [Desulfovibrionaceae bacterium]|nr:recombinase family protein [Desulfovibrionaceae bacterium]